MADLAFVSGRTPLLLKEIGTNTFAVGVVEADGEGDPNDDHYVPNGPPIYDAAGVVKQVVERFKGIGNGFFAKAIYLSSGTEGAPSSTDIVVGRGLHNVPTMFKDMGDGSHAEVVVQSTSGQVGDLIYSTQGVSERYRALGNGAYARVVTFSEDEDVEANDKLLPIGLAVNGITPSLFFKRLADGTYAQVLYPVDGEIVPPGEDEFGLLLNGRYIMLNGNYLVLV